MSESDHALAEILEWFSDLEAAIPGVRSTVGEILIGKIPESDVDAVYELSDAWGTAAQELASFYEEAVHAADGIMENWLGDGAAEAFTREWLSYLESLAGTVDTLASMEEAVHSFGLQIELMKFMALIGLIMLAVSLFMLVAAAIPSLGLSTAGIPGAFAACRAAIGAAATNAVRAIGSISVRAALAEVTALLTRTLPTLVRTQLPNLVRTQVPRLVTTQLPRFARTQVPAFVRQTLPTLTRQGAGNLARGVLPRNVVARSVADRMAGQWLRGVTNRELLRQLGREAGLESRRLAGRSLLAARNQLAREIEEQLLRQFGARVGTDLAARGGVRLAGTEAFEQLSRATLSQYATREIATTTFGRELTKYLGQRVAFGAAFMGGGDLLGQLYQIAGGERAGLDLGQLGISTAQGGLFGASMFGGVPGHVIGGGLAGGLVTGATDAAQGRFDLQNMLHGVAEGAKAGAIFGAQNKLETVRVGGMDLRIGRDVMVLPEGMAAVDRADGLRVTYSERGAVWEHVDASGQRVDGGAIAADGSVLARDRVRSPDPTVVAGDVTAPGGPRTTHPPVAALPPADLPQRTHLMGGAGGGDGGGGPRQPAHPTPVRTPEAGVRTAGPVRHGPGDGPPPVHTRAEPPVPVRDDAPPTGATRTDPAAPHPDGGRVIRGGVVAERTDPAGPSAPDADRAPSGPVTRADGPGRPEPPRPDDGPVPDRTTEDRTAPDDRDAQTGASIRPRDEVRAWDWAERAYDRFRADDHDLPDIAGHLADTPRPSGAVGFSPGEVRQVKRHLMADEHLLDDYEGGHRRARFDANPDIAEAWIRLREGRHLPEDLVLLEHELTEANYLLVHPDATYREAHDAANARYNWESIRPGRAGEDLDASWSKRSADGDPAGLRTGPGRQTGGGIHLRVPDDGPAAGHPEGHRPGETDGRPGGRELRGGVGEDPAVPPQRGALAPEGQLRGVAPGDGHVPFKLVPVESRPIGPSVPLPETVRSTFDGHVGELLAGRGPGPVDQPHRASWDESSRLLTVAYPDGLHVQVALQVNSALPPGQPVVLRPGLTVEHGQWVQREPAGVVLPDHLPTDPSARTAFVDRQLGDAWRTLHREIHQVLDRPDEPTPGVPEAGRDTTTTPDGPTRPEPARPEPARPEPARTVGEPSLAALEAPARPDPPVLDADAISFRDATAPAPAPPRPLTPDTVRGLLADGAAVPDQVRAWARDQLAVRQEDGSYLPHRQVEIDAAVARLRAETTTLVAQRVPADPNAAPPAAAPPAAAPPADARPADAYPRAADELPLSQELAPSSNFPAHRARTGAELPGQVHELVQKAKENLLGREQSGRSLPALRDQPAVPSRPRADAAAPPLAEWGPSRDGGQPVRPEPERRAGVLGRALRRVTGFLGGADAAPAAPEGGTTPRPAVPERAPEHSGRTPAPTTPGWPVPEPHQPAWTSGTERVAADPATPDARTLLKLTERRCIVDELRAATDPIDQVRLRDELNRLDTDLAQRGYPVHELERVPEADGAAPADRREQTRQDEIWSDPPWRQEDRRPSLDELIPTTREEAGARGEAVRREFADQLDGREFAGLRIRVDLTDPYSVSVHRNEVVVRATVHDPDGVPVGRVVRSFQRDHDGSLFVEHVSLKLSERVQGQGFAREWNGHLTEWYRYSGVERIEVHAASTIGGYAWARDGFDWAPNTEHRADGVLDRLRGELCEVDVDIELARRSTAGDGLVAVDRLRERYGTTDPDQVLREANRQREAGREILDRARTHSFGSTRYPTPFEISQAGWGDHHQGRDASWIGKRALLGADWKGVKRISDTGPLHPRSAYTVGLPRVPDPSAIHSLLSGGGPPPVTAARVPDAEFHGYGREVPEPELAGQLGADALRQVVDRLPADSTLRGVRLELTAVPADALPDGAVARSVPIDAHGRDLPHGTVPPDGGGWRVELSDRATDVNVARAVAHEAAELEAIGQRAAGGLDPFTPDALTPGVLADDAGLSPHDLGRLAEVEVLTDLLRDPVQAAYARTELRALRDHLGLHPDDPGAAARLPLLDGRLSDAGRDALLGRAGPSGEPARPPADGEPGHARDEGPPGRKSADAGLPGRARDDGTALVGRDGDGLSAVRPDAVDPAAPMRADLAAATYPARVSRVPFEFERFLHDPRWSDGATRFEQRLGAHYFRDPEVLDTVRTALTRMRDILVELIDPLHPGETRAEVVARVESAFFRDDEPASAGQVGTSVSFDRLLAEGNLRETMTAFYNAAYCNWKNPHTLSHVLLSVLDEGRWEQAQGAGVDVGAVRRMGGLLDGTVNRLMPDALRDRLKFGRDFFATGNVARSSAHGIRDLTEMTASQSPRRPRSDEEQLALANTPDHYARLGTPLGRLERAYVDQLNREKTGDPLGDHGLLPWREGVTAHDTDHGPWARWVGRDGFPVIDGVSGTTARMLTAARFVGLDGPRAERFLSGLMGWMLPARDHSLFEILRGAEIAGIQRVELRPSDGRFTAVDLYRSLPDVDLPTLRAEVAVDGLFPHEARYLDHAVDPHGFSETQHKVPAIADRLWPQLASGQVRDADLADWLRRNGIDPADTAAVRGLGQRLSKPHVMALAVYTRHSHYLINNVIRAHLFTGAAGEVPSRALFDRKVRELVAGYLGNLAAGSKALPLPLMLRSVVHVGDGHLTARSELAGPARDWVDAHRRVVDAQRRIDEHHRLGQRHDERQARADKQRAKRDAATSWKQIRRGLDAVLPRLFDEVVWHADMVHDAMMQLPAVGRPDRPLIAFRGDWITPIYSPIYGSSWHPTGMAREFLSVSRRLDVAVRFMSENPASGGKVLVVYRLSGQQARDIAVFSSFATDEEAVFPPRSRVRRTSDPQLAAQIRAQLPAEFQDNCEIIVMEED